MLIDGSSGCVQAYYIACHQNNNIANMAKTWWTSERVEGPKRVNHACVSIRNRYVFSFGGYCTGDEYLRLEKMDIHIFDLDKLSWTKLRMADIHDDDYSCVPYMRYGHTASAIGEKVYIFGGRNDRNGACNSLFCFDTNTFRWSMPKIYGPVPAARDGHSACVIDNKIFIFGGYEQVSERFSKDIHVLDTETLTWFQPCVSGEPASWRDFHTATAVGKYMYIFGGRGDLLGQFHSNQEIYDNQVVVFDTERCEWEWIVTSGEAPVGRRSHSAFAYRGCIYIFGGYNGLEQRHYGDTYKFDTESRIWQRIEIPGNVPCPRRRHCCALLDEIAVLFGGTSPIPGTIHVDESGNNLQDHNDLYILDLNPSLKTLCKLAVVKYKLNKEHLPRSLKLELLNMTSKTARQKPALKTSQG